MGYLFDYYEKKKKKNPFQSVETPKSELSSSGGFLQQYQQQHNLKSIWDIAPEKKQVSKPSQIAAEQLKQKEEPSFFEKIKAGVSKVSGTVSKFIFGEPFVSPIPQQKPSFGETVSSLNEKLGPILAKVYVPLQYEIEAIQTEKRPKLTAGKIIGGFIEDAISAYIPVSGIGLKPSTVSLTQRLVGGIKTGSTFAGLHALVKALKQEQIEINDLLVSGGIGAWIGASNPSTMSDLKKEVKIGARQTLEKYGFTVSDFKNPEVLKSKFFNVIKSEFKDVQTGKTTPEVNKKYQEFIEAYNKTTSAGIDHTWKFPDIISWVKNLWRDYKKSPEEKAIIKAKADADFVNLVKQVIEKKPVGIETIEIIPNLNKENISKKIATESNPTTIQQILKTEVFKVIDDNIAVAMAKRFSFIDDPKQIQTEIERFSQPVETEVSATPIEVEKSIEEIEEAQKRLSEYETVPPNLLTEADKAEIQRLNNIIRRKSTEAVERSVKEIPEKIISPISQAEPQSYLQKTPSDLQDLFDETQVKINQEVIEPAEARIKALREQKDKIKSLRDKKSIQKKKKINEEIQQLHEKISEVKSKFQDDNLEFQRKLALGALTIAKKQGVGLGEIGDAMEGASEKAQEFRDDFLARLTEPAYIEKTWNIPIKDILRDMVEEYGGKPTEIKEVKPVEIEGVTPKEQQKFIKEFSELSYKVSRAEKFTPIPKGLPDWTKDWKAFSRSRGYTEQEIADFERYLQMYKKAKKLGISEEIINDIWYQSAAKASKIGKSNQPLYIQAKKVAPKKVEEGRVIFDPSRVSKEILVPMTALNPKDKYAAQVRYKGLAVDEQLFNTREEAQKFLDRYKFHGVDKSVVKDYVAWAKKYGEPLELEQQGLVKYIRSVAGIAQEKVGGKISRPSEISKEELAETQRKIRMPKTFSSELEEKSLTVLREDPISFRDRYIEKNDNEIDPDLMRPMIEGYEGYNATEVDKFAGALTEIVFDHLLETRQEQRNNTVLLTAGGPGSGKSSVIGEESFTENKKKYSVILDTTFSSKRSIDSIKKALANGYNVQIMYVLRDPVVAWKNGVLPRIKETGRVVTEGYFLDAHDNARKNILDAYKQHKDNSNVFFEFIDNTGTKAKVATIETISNFSYNRSQAVEQIKAATDQAYGQKNLSKQEYEAITKDRKGYRPRDGGRSESSREEQAEDQITPSEKKPAYERGKITALENKLNELVGYTPSGEHWKMQYHIRNAYIDEALTSAPPDIQEQVRVTISALDEARAARGESAATRGGFASLEILTQTPAEIPIMEMPEMVRLVREISGKVPTVQKYLHQALGRSYSGTLDVKLLADIFKDPVVAAKVLAHEIGHIADYLPQGIRKNTLLVGRILSLNDFLKQTFGDLKDKTLRMELKVLSYEWRPLPGGVETTYRKKSAELYADAISVLLNDPVRLQTTAPTFYKAFFENLDKKPSVKKELEELWNTINAGEEEVYKKRDEEIDRSFQKGEEAFATKFLDKQKRTTSFFYHLKLLFDDKNTPIREKIKQAVKQGKVIPPELNPDYALKGLLYSEGELKNYVIDNWQPAYTKAQEVPNGWEKVGKIVFYERVINERGELANPQGYSPKTAQDQLNKLEQKTGTEEWAILQEAKEIFRQGSKNINELAKKNEFYTPELISQMEANPYYATFQVIDYLDTYITARVIPQMGTLKDIANPATSTVMKSIQIFKAIKRNNAKKLNIKFLKENFPQDIEDARTVWAGNRLEIKPPKDFDKDLVIVIEKGKPKGYYVDKDIAEMLNYTSNRTLEALARVSRVISQSPFYRPLLTTYNLGFQTFNFVRDLRRAWRNYPHRTLAEVPLAPLFDALRIARGYAKGIIPSARRIWNKPDDLIKEMENANILGLTYNDIYSGEVDPEMKQIERIFEKTGLFKKKKKANLLTPFVFVLDRVGELGNFIETLPKVAGYIELKGKMSETELSEFIRTSVGSPAFRVGGRATPISNQIFLFSNAIKEGIKTDLAFAIGKRGKASAASFWWKTLLSDFLPTLIVAGMAYGLFGEKIKKMIDNVSEYDKTNYTIIPIGTDKNGKTIYYRIPHDETGRFLKGILWKIITANEDKDSVQSFFDVFNLGMGQFPSLSPSFVAIGALMQYLAGKNPYDSFRGRTIIPDREFKAGPKYSLPILLDWLVKNQGLGIAFPSYKPEDPTELEKLLTMPVLSNILGRWIKVSDKGRVEQLEKISKTVEQERSQRILEERKVIDEAIKEYKKKPGLFRKRELERKVIEKTVGKNADKADKTKIIKKFRVGIIRGEGDENMNALIDANTNAEKVELLLSIRDQMTESEFTSFYNTARREKIVSDDVAKEYRRRRK